jgi:hypothetical protein
MRDPELIACSVCTHVFDVRSLEEKWETTHDMTEGFKIVYICPTANSLTPLNIQKPKGRLSSTARIRTNQVFIVSKHGPSVCSMVNLGRSIGSLFLNNRRT